MSPPRSVSLIDPFASGHHISYARWLAAGLLQRGLRVQLIGPGALLDGARAGLAPELAELLEVQPLDIHPGPLERYFALPLARRTAFDRRFLRQAAGAARDFGSELAHLLYLDRLVLPLLLAWPAFRGLSVQATLHWVPSLSGPPPARRSARVRALAERLALARLQRLGLHLQLHSPRFAAALGGPQGRASALPYPAPPPPPLEQAQAQARALRQALGLRAGDQLLLAFGGTRLDKGADLAARLLPELSERVHLLVAGRDEGFGGELLSRLAGPAAGRLHLHLRFVTEAEAPALFLAADLLLLPYRRAFAGQSGPLTTAAALGRPVVAADSGLLGETVRAYGLGPVFEPENPEALRAATLEALARPPTPASAAFLRDHSLDAFVSAALAAYGRR